MLKIWDRYWFSPAPCLDLAVVRIIACAFTLFYIVGFHDYFEAVAERAALDSAYYEPVFIFKLLNAHLGWGLGPDGVWMARPSGDFVYAVLLICVASGVLSLVGLFTTLSLACFAVTFVYVQAYVYSFGDFHHPEAVMAVALAAMALSPAGRVLSVDSLLFRRSRASMSSMYDSDAFAGWPLKLVQWFFVLMYLSAVFAKLSHSGLGWANGYTLQYYLARDAIRWGGDFGLWLSQFHYLVIAGQVAVLAFQATFCLAVIFPALRWIYIPAGIALHTFIYLTLSAPFFTWIALYAVFIPWSEIGRRFHVRADVPGE
jgi:hypothetical protein